MSVEIFDKELNLIITNAIETMLKNNQNELDINHICYAIFKSFEISGKDKTFNFNNDLILKRFLDDIVDKGIRIDNSDMSISLKDLIFNCHIDCLSKGLSKINKFEFLKAIFKENLFSKIFTNTRLNINKINLMYMNYDNSSYELEKSNNINDKNLSPKLNRRKRLNSNYKFKLISENKNDVGNFLINLNEKYNKEDSIFFDYDNKIIDITKCLLRKDKSNPLLIGKPGVGKTALIAGLVKNILSGNVPDKLKGKVIMELNLSSLISGTNFRGDFEKRFENIVKFLSENKNIIIFIDEIHCLKNLGAASKGDLDLSNMIKPYLSSGEISCIGATTYEEYKISIGSDNALSRRFELIDIKEPDINKTVEIIKNKKNIYEKFHKIKIDNDLIDYIVALTDRFISKGNFPDKAFDVLDLSCASASLKNIKSLDKNIIIETISKLSGIEYNQILGKDKIILNLSKIIKESIFGQDKQIDEICNKIIVSKVGLSNQNKPMASFLLIGNTGVGKTEVVNKLSKELSMNFIRFDMSEFSEKGSVSRLIGTSAGYIGYDDGGQLTEHVYNHPYSIILFDEIEKADKTVFNIFLQILDYGKLSDGSGKVIDFKNTIIFMTSNSGAVEMNKKSIGLKPSKNNNFEKSINATFSPEFRNRISKIIFFNNLENTTMKKLIEKNLNDLTNKLKAMDLKVKFTEKVYNILIKNGFDEKLGARPLERYIEDNISILIAKSIIEEKIKKEICVDFNDNEFFIN